MEFFQKLIIIFSTLGIIIAVIRIIYALLQKRKLKNHVILLCAVLLVWFVSISTCVQYL